MFIFYVTVGFRAAPHFRPIRTSPRGLIFRFHRLCCNIWLFYHFFGHFLAPGEIFLYNRWYIIEHNTPYLIYFANPVVYLRQYIIIFDIIFFVFAFFFSACRTGSSLLSFGGFNIQLTVSPALWSNTSFMVGRVLRDYAGTGCWNQVRKNCSCWWGQHFLFLWPSSGSPPPGTSILPPIAASEE